MDMTHDTLEMRATQEQLQLAIDAADLGTWELDLSTESFTNRSLRHDQMFGSRERQPQWDLATAERHVVDEDKPVFREAFTRALRTGQVSFEVRVRWPDRTVHWIVLRGRTYYDESGQPVRMAGVVADVTARRAAEAALHESQRRQAFLLELSDALRPLEKPHAVQRKASRLLREQLGAACVLYLEIPAPDEMESAAYDFAPGVPENWPPRLRISDYGAALEAQFRAGRTTWRDDVTADAGLSEPLKTAHAALRVAAWATTPLVKNGVPVAALVVNFTEPHAWSADELSLIEETAERTWAAVERARAEKALRESERKYRTLFETMTEGFCICELLRDASGRAVDLRWIEANAAMEQQAGMPREAWLGRLASEVLPQLGRAWSDTYQRVVDSGIPARFEQYTAQLDRWYAATAFPYGEGRFAVVYDDITERKRSDAQQAFLLRLSDALRPLTDPIDIQAQVSRLLGEHLRVNRVLIGEFVGDEVFVHRDYVNGVPSMVGRYPIAMFGGEHLQVYERGKTFVVDDVLADSRLADIDRSAYAQAGIAALIGIGLLRQGRVVAAFGIHSRTPRRWSPAEAALVREVGERTWAAIERARSEMALRERDEQLRKMLQIPTVGIIHFDMQGGITQANDAFLGIVGFTREELESGKVRYEALTPPEWRWRDGKTMAELEAAGRSVPFEKEYFRKDGSRIWILCAAMMFDERTAVEFIIDVTDRRRTEESLRVSEERYRTLTNLVPVLLWQTDASGREMTLHHRWLAYTGQTIQETQGGGWLAAVHPDDRDNTRRAFEAAYAAQQPLEVEHRVRGVDGSYRWFLARQLPLHDAQGRIVAWFGAAIDIDEQRTARELLEQRVAERTRALRQLLQHVETLQDEERRRIARELHDGLGQYLSSMALTVSALRNAPDDPMARASLERLHELMQRLDQELDRIVFVLRPTALEDCGLGEGVAAYVHTWSQLTGVAVDLELHGLDKARLRAPVEAAVFRVVQEALTNVAKYAQASQVSLSLGRRRGQLVGSIEDDGVGFDVTDTTSREAGLTHWGLLGMQERIEALGGSFAIDSRPGSGTTVLWRLPLSNSGE